MIEEAHDLLDEGILDVYDRTLLSMDKWGVSLDKKAHKRRTMAKLLDDTSTMNSTLSNLLLARFQHEMGQRKEKLAFMMDKIYYIRKLQPQVYESLVDCGAMLRVDPFKNADILVAPRVEVEEVGDKVINAMFKKELPAQGDEVYDG